MTDSLLAEKKADGMGVTEDRKQPERSLSSAVYDLCWGPADRERNSALLFLINFMAKTSANYLKYQEVIGRHIRWDKKKVDRRRPLTFSEVERQLSYIYGREGEIGDLAIDCVASLFQQPSPNGEYLHLVRYFGPMFDYGAANNGTMPKDAETLIALRRLVIKKTKQELSRVFKERDPEGAKLVRNVRVAVGSSKDLVIGKVRGATYIAFRKSFPALDPMEAVHESKDNNNVPAEFFESDKRPLMPEKDVRTRYLDVCGPKEHTSGALRKMIKIVQEDSRYKNCVTLDSAVRLFRLLQSEMLRQHLVGSAPLQEVVDRFQATEITLMKNVGLEKVNRKIDEYFAAGKINDELAEIYKRALASVIDSVICVDNEDGHVRVFKRVSYWKCLQVHIPWLTQGDYRDEHRTIFEYLGKLLFKNLRELVGELFEPDVLTRKINLPSPAVLPKTPEEYNKRVLRYLKAQKMKRCACCKEYHLIYEERKCYECAYAFKILLLQNAGANYSSSNGVLLNEKLREISEYVQ